MGQRCGKSDKDGFYCTAHCHCGLCVIAPPALSQVEPSIKSKKTSRETGLDLRCPKKQCQYSAPEDLDWPY